MRLRRNIIGLVLVVTIAGIVSAQDNSRALKAYQDRFGDATAEIKLQILQTADAIPVEELGPLYVQALQYSLTRADDLESDVVLKDITLLSVEKIAEGRYTPALLTLWRVFLEHEDNTARIAILDVIGDLGPGDSELTMDLNGWVQAQTNLYRGGVVGDLQVLDSAVGTLGLLQDASSFPVLLDIQLAHISRIITATALGSMKSLPGDYIANSIQSINRRTIANQLPALEYLLDDPELSADERAQIATGVLSQAVRTSTRDVTERRSLAEIRYRATTELIEVPYEPATDSLIRHFNATFREYDRGNVTRSWVLDAIAALGRTGSSAAADRLTEFLDLLNVYTENSRPYDAQITLAVIDSLEQLRDIVAYDALFYVTLLDYPRRVKDAARSALDAVTQ